MTAEIQREKREKREKVKHNKEADRRSIADRRSTKTDTSNQSGACCNERYWLVKRQGWGRRAGDLIGTNQRTIPRPPHAHLLLVFLRLHKRKLQELMMDVHVGAALDSDQAELLVVDTFNHRCCSEDWAGIMELESEMTAIAKTFESSNQSFICRWC